MSNSVKFAAFSTEGCWRLEETRANVFVWLKKSQKDLPKDLRFDRIYRLRGDKDLYDAKYQLFRIMRKRYRVEPV